MDLGLRDRVVLITGGGGGSGPTAGPCVRGGRRRRRPPSAAPSARAATPSRAEATAAEIVATWRPGGRRRRRAALDGADRGHGRRRRIRLGPVGVLVTATSAYSTDKFAEVKDDTWVSVVDDILGATFRTCRAVVPGMAGAGWGRIVNISARSGLVGHRPGLALRGGEGRDRRSDRVACQGARAVGDPRQRRRPGPDPDREGRRPVHPRGAGGRPCQEDPLRRVATPDDLASLVVWLGSGANTFVSGETISLTGGDQH